MRAFRISKSRLSDPASNLTDILARWVMLIIFSLTMQDCPMSSISLSTWSFFTHFILKGEHKKRPRSQRGGPQHQMYLVQRERAHFQVLKLLLTSREKDRV